MIIAAYCRVSTNSLDQANSLENQKSYFSNEITKQGHTLFKIYADQGLTGTQLDNRPEFENMLYDAGIDVNKIKTNRHDNRKKATHTVYTCADREPRFNEIWIKNTSRFARNTLSYDILAKLRQKNVNVFFVEQNLNLKDVQQDFLLKLFQVFDEHESKDRSLKVLTGIKESARKGKIFTNGRLYGYRYIKDERRLEIREDEAKTIHKIFELYAGGLGVRQIINWLNEHGLKTREGKQFCKTAIMRILDNEKYAGLNNALKYDTGAVMNKNSYAKVKSDYEVRECAAIPAIISKELFYECRALKETKVNYNQQLGIYKGISKYHGMIFCGKCGAVYTSNRDKGRQFYNCSTKKSKGIEYCDNKNVNGEYIDQFVDTLSHGGLAKTIEAEKERALKAAMDTIKYKLDMMNEERTQEVKLLDREIESKKKELAHYYMMDAQRKGEPDLLGVLGELIRKTESELKDLTKRRTEAGKENEEIAAEIKGIWETYLEIIETPVKDQYSAEETIEMVDKFIVTSTEKGTKIEAVINEAERLESMISKYRHKIPTVPQNQYKLVMEELEQKILNN
jgi:site-specific DNA recombinase